MIIVKKNINKAIAIIKRISNLNIKFLIIQTIEEIIYEWKIKNKNKNINNIKLTKK